jgi:mxaL protein
MRRELFNHVVVLDVTQSMNVQDHVLDGKPASRLAYAKHALRQALLKLPCGSKIGLGLFTEYRAYLLFTPVEVCANLQELRSSLAQIDGRMAWTGNSEVTKGLFSGLGIARQLPDAPSLVFVTDGHEAPPLDPSRRPAFNGKAGEVAGLIVGVGGLKPLPIPKLDPLGRPLGYWEADEVLQAAPRVGAPGGSEHLSSLHEAHLRRLAGETGLNYLQLMDGPGLARALTVRALARPVPARLDLRSGLATIALALLLWRHLHPSAFRRRGQAPSRAGVQHARAAGSAGTADRRSNTPPLP